MSESTEQPGRANGVLNWFARVFVAVVVLIALTPCLWMAVVFYQFTHSDTLVAIEPGTVTDHVAWVLTDLGVDGPPPKLGPEHDRIKAALKSRIRAINGYHSAGGLQGDGEDAYWVELSPELADRVREVVPKSAEFKPYSFGPPGGSSVDWWPKKWPESTKCYRDNRDCFLMVPDAGNQLWYMSWRS